jgi:hypothetical protein
VRQYRSHWWDPNYKPPAKSSGNNGQGSKTEGYAKIDLATNNDCEIENVKEVKTENKRQCYPGIIFESMYEHEKTHARQCRDKETSSEYKSGTPKSYQKFEIEAYCVGISILLNYAKEHCKDHDLKPYEKEFKRLCGK